MEYSAALAGALIVLFVGLYLQKVAKINDK
jgi:hypothetical protein